MSRSTVYEDNSGSIVVTTSPMITPTSKHTTVKYHWFRQHVRKDVLIWKNESENKKADIFTKGLQCGLFLGIRRLLCGW